MDNRALIKAFRLTAQLLELHDENAFKIRAYEGTATALEQLEFTVAEVERPGLPDRTGLSKTQAAKVAELLDTGTFKELQELLDKTPPGVAELLNIKGIGPKKVRALWRDAGIESPEQLREAAEAGRVAKLKGFGAKTQESLLAALAFTDQSAGKLLFSQAEQLAHDLAARLRQEPGVTEAAATGEVRRALEIVETVEIIVATEDPAPIHAVLNAAPGLRADVRRSGPFAWRGTVADSGVAVAVRMVAPADFANQLFLSTGNEAHLSTPLPSAGPGLPATLRQWAKRERFASEETLYEKAGLQYVVPELREGLGEIELAAERKLPQLLQDSDLRGSLHNHSTYSDGSHSLRQMATFLRDAGYEYLGICDHSQAARRQ